MQRVEVSVESVESGRKYQKLKSDAALNEYKCLGLI